MRASSVMKFCQPGDQPRKIRERNDFHKLCFLTKPLFQWILGNPCCQTQGCDSGCASLYCDLVSLAKTTFNYRRQKALLNLKNVLYAFYTETISLLISKRDKAFDVATERKYGSSLQLHWTLRADAKKGIIVQVLLMPCSRRSSGPGSGFGLFKSGDNLTIGES